MSYEVAAGMALVGMLLFSALQGGLQLARIDDGALPLLKQQVRVTLGLAKS